jgi:hypothetical protein
VWMWFFIHRRASPGPARASPGQPLTKTTKTIKIYCLKCLEHCKPGKAPELNTICCTGEQDVSFVVGDDALSLHRRKKIRLLLDAGSRPPFTFRFFSHFSVSFLFVTLCVHVCGCPIDWTLW